MIYEGNFKNYLKSNDWIKIRNFVFDRDGRKCLKCQSHENLNAHHLYYINGRPDLTPINHIVTLCSICHNLEHKEIDFKLFLLGKKKKYKKVVPKKNKPKNKIYSMSKRDKELQKRYDAHRL